MFSSNLALLLLEVCVYAGAAALVLLFPRLRLPLFSKAEGICRRLAHKRLTSITVVIASVLVIRGLMMFFLPIPVPAVHDEFSYILAADTFSSGRLTNPPHPLWKSFETFYVIQNPTYASMYPPAQGMLLAVGDVVAGRPWIGVYLSVALMCGAICWMLQGWVPPQWALLGGILAALRLGIYSYWSESYWGGAAAAIGGALVLGALPRIIRTYSALAAVILAIGLLILANSRPFEGVLLALPVFGLLLLRLFRPLKVTPAIVLSKVALPISLVMLLGLCMMSFYFWRVTGNPLKMPYQLHSELYEVTGPFLWQPLRKVPFYRYAVMEQYHVPRQTASFVQAHSLKGWLTETAHKAESLSVFYLWPALLPTVTALVALRKNFKIQFALLTILVMFVGLSLEIWPMTLHYHAPITAIMILLQVQATRFWRTITWRGRPVGLAISRAIPLFCAAMLIFRVSAAVVHAPLPEHGLVPWFTVVPGNLYRERISQFLENQPGQQLVLVRYSSQHHVDEEWVHNAADIDRSKTVWARYGSDEDNTKLLKYFRNRRKWLVDVDAKEGHIAPLPLSLSSLKAK